MFVHSYVVGHSACAHLLAAVNNVAVNVRGMPIFLRPAVSSCTYVPRSGVTGSGGNFIYIYISIL